MNIVKSKDLKLGDIVGPPEDTGRPFTTAIVKRIKGDEITLFRPYGTNADFEYIGGLICYVGIEEYTVLADDGEWRLYKRQDIK